MENKAGSTPVAINATLSESLADSRILSIPMTKSKEAMLVKIRFNKEKCFLFDS